MSTPYTPRPDQRYPGPQPGAYSPQPSLPGYPPADPAAPYGRDPMTGAPLSNKQKVVAGLLQFFLGSFGIGNFYLDDTRKGFIHLGLFLGGFFVMFLGLLAMTPLGGVLAIFMFLGNWAWAMVEGFMIFTDKVPDQYGRQLR